MTQKQMTQNKPMTTALMVRLSSCPDVLLDEVIRKIISWFPDKISINQAISSYKNIRQNHI